ncbi:hypothetical protein Sjap_007648 [Stephania japonica]|uniref:F-box domain-containing protein n=1 Tax=Stephania japonica TaxID=461633 RepID=A0AAP0JNE1_9MAGN
MAENRTGNQFEEIGGVIGVGYDRATDPSFTGAEEILSKVPPYSLLRFKFACKKWRDLIKSQLHRGTLSTIQDQIDNSMSSSQFHKSRFRVDVLKAWEKFIDGVLYWLGEDWLNELKLICFDVHDGVFCSDLRLLPDRSPDIDFLDGMTRIEPTNTATKLMRVCTKKAICRPDLKSQILKDEHAGASTSDLSQRNSAHTPSKPTSLNPINVSNSNLLEVNSPLLQIGQKMRGGRGGPYRSFHTRS